MCDGDTLDHARAFEIYDKVTMEGSEGYPIPPLPLQSGVSDNFHIYSAQQLAQAVIARFKLYPDVPEKTRLLGLMDILIVNCDRTFHRHLAEEGFFQTLISDRKV